MHNNFPIKKQQKLLFLMYYSMKIMFVSENFLLAKILLNDPDFKCF